MFKEISNLSESSKEFLSVLEFIKLKTEELENNRIKYLLAKAKYEKDFSEHFLEIKLKNPNMTQKEISAQTIVLLYLLKIELINFESKYKQSQNELRFLKDQLDSLKEISYNLRRDKS